MKADLADLDRRGAGLIVSPTAAVVRPVGSGISPLSPSLSGARPHRRKPVPPAFAEIFIRFGWRGVEDVYRSRTGCNARWVDQCGGMALKAERWAYRKRLQTLRRARRSC